MNVPVPRPGARSKAFPADEFFAAQISNSPTRRAHAVALNPFAKGITYLT